MIYELLSSSRGEGVDDKRNDALIKTHQNAARIKRSPYLELHGGCQDPCVAIKNGCRQTFGRSHRHSSGRIEGVPHIVTQRAMCVAFVSHVNRAELLKRANPRWSSHTSS